MGGSSSKNLPYTEALSLLTPEERERTGAVHKKITGGVVGKDVGFDEKQLRAYVSSMVDDALVAPLFAYMASRHHQAAPHLTSTPTSIPLEGFTITLARIFRGTIEEKSAFLLSLCEESSEVEKEKLKQTLVSLLSSLLKCLEKTNCLTSWKLPSGGDSVSRLADCLMLELETDGKIQSEEVERWLSRTALLLKTIDTTFSLVFPVKEEEVIMGELLALFPVCEEANWDKLKSVLDVPSVLLLSDAVQTLARSPWRLLFSSTVQGLSFGTMVKCIKDKGPSLIILKDAEGYTFGGFASQSWTHTSDFIGTSNCFLFQTTPALHVYTSTDYNKHFMYLNAGQETLPNGLGMGGQFDYFGLFLDTDFGNGHSGADCTTFNSPQLSGSPKFTFTEIEIWGIGPDPQIRNEEEEVSILDKDPAGKAMLKLLEKGPVSEGLRDRDPMAESPQETDPPPFAEST